MPSPILSEYTLSTTQLNHYHDDGFVVIPELAGKDQVERMREVALTQLREQRQPIEYEADVAYPGAPPKRSAQGGDTPRRLLQAYDRHAAFSDWAHNEQCTGIIKQLLQSQDICLTRNHHNCVMTKHSGYSSATLWHQDLRYWSYAEPELINSWLALGDETPQNGCMWLLPGSHRINVPPERLDTAKFLRPDLAANAALIASARSAELHAGDVLFFHAGVFHAAGRNETENLKLSTVLTYHCAQNQPTAGSNSARLADVEIS